MKLKQLIKRFPMEVKGNKDIDITSITANSKQVTLGCLFVAKSGLSYHGNRFAKEAIEAGAVAILSDLYDPFLPATQLISHEVFKAELHLLKQLYRDPISHLFMVGITGTNGKTTTSYLVRHFLPDCGLIGTIEWIIKQKVLPSTHTTPDLSTLFRLFSEMVTQGCSQVVMEVSSHALDQNRAYGVEFDVAVYTNLTLDHLDYHQTMENYAFAKSKLFRSLTPKGYAIYNIDCPWHKNILEGCIAKKISYGFDALAKLRACDLKLNAEEMSFTIHYEGLSYSVVSKVLIGRFNVYNLLAAIGVALSYGLTMEKILELLPLFQGVAGRLEKVLNPRNLNIFVDYSHTDDSLKNALETLNECKKGRIITVFGCGGNREVSKRPKMARIAEVLSDFTIVTTDNPRKEDPQSIIRDIIAGFKHRNFVVEADRKSAIERAISLATPQDIVLIAGKGHENYQIFSNETIYFSDREVAYEATIC
jgi:UDP-N-acetylmuramoyl-L-alanyl-D-glutamate--2,6-diaminopimelate ligase